MRTTQSATKALPAPASTVGRLAWFGVLAMVVVLVLTACGPQVSVQVRADFQDIIDQAVTARDALNQEVSSAGRTVTAATAVLGEDNDQVAALHDALSRAVTVLEADPESTVVTGIDPEQADEIIAKIEHHTADLIAAHKELVAQSEATTTAVEGRRLEVALKAHASSKEDLAASIALAQELLEVATGKIDTTVLEEVLNAAMAHTGNAAGDSSAVNLATYETSTARGKLDTAIDGAQDALAAWIDTQTDTTTDAPSIVIPGRPNGTSGGSTGGGSTGGSSSSGGSTGGSGSTGGGTGSTGGGTTTPPFEPWQTVETSAGDTTAFCNGLNNARTSNGKSGYTSCSQSTTLMNHAKAMAEAGSAWHSGNDAIVGGGSSISDLMSKFMASSGHRAIILTDQDPVSAVVGCYVRKVTAQAFVDVPPMVFTGVYCAMGSA